MPGSGFQNFGFLLGQLAEPSHLGIAGFLLRSAPNVRSALNSLAKFLSLHDQGGIVSINSNDNRVYFDYAIIEDNVEAADQIYDLSIVLACKIMRALCGEKWIPEQVQLKRNKPKDLMSYNLFFKSPIHFNSNKSNIIFNKCWLDYSNPSADTLLQQYLLKEAEHLHIKQSEKFVTMLRKLLYQNLTNQQFTAFKIARQLGVHERTLHRYLKHHGTTFRQELEQTRCALSKQLLSETSESVLNIALSLGYANSATFSRAFKQWFGKSPTQWRKEFFYINEK